jgi:hypothetical protein
MQTQTRKLRKQTTLLVKHRTHAANGEKNEKPPAKKLQKKIIRKTA